MGLHPHYVSANEKIIYNKNSLRKHKEFTINKSSDVIFTYYSLFAGIGGMTMGLESLGGKCLGAWEYDPDSKTQFAQEAHKLLHHHIPIHGDVKDINPHELDDFDVLCFTPPCQSFSVAGLKKGFEDTRGTLTFNALEIAKIKQPKILFMENVKGLLGHDKGNTMITICHAINEIGYYVDFTLLNSKYFGVAQNRERLYLVAIRKDLLEQGVGWNFSKYNNITKRIKQKLHNEGVFGFNFNYPIENNSNINLYDFLETEVDSKYLLKDNINSLLQKQLSNLNLHEHYIRKLTPSESLRLQSIPEEYIKLLNDNFDDKTIYKFAGNGLTINVIREIAKGFVEILK